MFYVNFTGGSNHHGCFQQQVVAEWDAVVSHAGCLQAMQALEIWFGGEACSSMLFFGVVFF